MIKPCAVLLEVAAFVRACHATPRPARKPATRDYGRALVGAAVNSGRGCAYQSAARISPPCLGLSLFFLAISALDSPAASGPPIITVQPASQVVMEGDPATFSVTADGTPPLAYQWRRNGTNIAHATNAAYTLPTTSLADHLAVFSVVVTNALGSVTSSNATLRIDPGTLVTNTVTLVSMDHSWRFHQTGADLGTAWRQPAYDDSASPWQTGAGVFDAKSGTTRTSIGGETIRTQLTLDSTPGNRVITYYFRARFNFSTQNVVSVRLRANAIVDDGFAAYLNGQEIVRAGLIPAALASDWANRTIGDAALESFGDLPGTLLGGTNVLAAELHQVNNTSSDVTFGMALLAEVVTRARDTVPPTVQQVLPAPNTTVNELTLISVTFDEPVQGVNAADLLINNAPATGLFPVSAREYQFTFPQPATGIVTVAWASGHGITDLAATPNAFAGGSWTLTFDPNALRPTLLISEFLADNTTGLQDEDGTRADWIEIYNPGPLDANLEGWFLTDDALEPTKWRFPSVNLGANKYLLVWASEKNRTNPAAPLHTNFRLDRSGEYLALLDPRTNVVSAFAPLYPPQQANISYGRDRADANLLGYFLTPTPGAQNSTSGTGFAPEPVFSVDSGVYTNNTLSVVLTTRSGTIRYTTDGSVPTTSSTAYTTPITVSANTTIKARVFQTGLWPSPVVARTYILLDATTAEFNSNLPLLILNTSGSAIAQNVAPGQPRTRGSLVAIEPVGGRAWLRTPPQFQGLAEFEIFGQTSAGFPKKPYNIEIQDELGNDRAVELLGLPAEADWKLRNPYSDKCMMNDFLGYELFEQMGHYQVRRRFVEVFVDTSGGKLSYPGDYHGILVLLEKIERGKDRVDLAELTPAHTNEPAITGGYMFKKDKDSTGDLNFSTTGGAGFTAQALKIHEPKPRDITTAQLNWLRNHLNLFESKLYAANWLSATGTNHYSHYIDVDSFVDQHWIVEFTKQIDGYRLSSYFSKDRGGKIKWEPIWDWNLAFGNADYADGWNTTSFYYHQINENQHIWIRRLITGTTASTGTSGDPDFNQKIIDRWSVLRTNVLHGPRVAARVQELADYLAEAAARDFAKFPRLGTYIWPNPAIYSTPTTYGGIITNMKAWILGRYQWIDSLYVPVPTLSHPGGPVSLGLSLAMSSPGGGTLYYTLDGTDPRLPGGAVSPQARSYTGPVTLTNNVRVFARVLRSGAWSGPTINTFYTAIPTVRITEIMYRPDVAPGDTNDPGNFEYVELTNVGTNVVSLVGMRFTRGIDFTFTATNNVTTLAPGSRVVVVKKRAAFLTRYPGLAALVAGEYGGSLDNAGERLTLVGPVEEPIHDFRYENNWHPLTDGSGFSLAVVDESAPLSAWSDPTQWRPSAFDGGSPGQPEPPAAEVLPVLITEVLTAPVPPEVDAIELFNPNAVAVDLGHWYLSDNLGVPRKYRFPAGTIIPPGGYLVLYETNTFNSPTAAINPFALSSNGDEVHLFSGDSIGRLTGYHHGFDFGPAAAGVTFGRHLASGGVAHYVAQSANTLGTANAPPLVGPVVISEFMFYPPELPVAGGRVDNARDEFIELHNLSDTPVPLYDPNRPANTWKLEKAVNYSFPTNAVLAPGAFALVVSFDPVADFTSLAAFRARYALPTNATLFGPYTGRLNNTSERIELRRPGAPNPTTGAAPMILADRVDYGPLPPWSAGGGTGASLQRRALADFGNDPANWLAAQPSPGQARIPGEPPVIVSAPQSQTVVEESSVSFGVTVTGTGPFVYQWYWNGQPLEGATSPTLLLTNLVATQSGDYAVYVLGGGGSVMSSPARLTVLRVPIITQQPVGTNVNPGADVTFRVVASGTGSLTYQWQFNGVDLPGATSDTLLLTNVQLVHSGMYRVRVTDTVGTRTSQEAQLFILVRPSIVQQPSPVNQTVAVGRDAFIRVEATGAQPLGYRWRKNGVTYVSNGVETLSLTNVDLATAGYYEVVITNLAGGTIPSLSARAYVVVVDPPVSQAVAPGANVTLRALVGSPGNMTNRFWWLYNGASIVAEGTNARTVSTAGIFTNDLVLANVTAAQTGQYTFLLSNAVMQTNLVSTNIYAVTTAFTATLVVGDTEPPTITCLGDLVMDADPGRCTASPDLTPTATDNIGVIGIACAPSGPFPLGPTPVTCWAWDLAGNSNSCAFTLTVADRQSPVLTDCPPPVSLLAGTNGLALMPDLRGALTASDNCGPPVLIQVPAPGAAVGPGTNVVTLTAQDAAGNLASCQTAVMVETPVTAVHLAVELQANQAIIRWPHTPPVVWALEEATDLTPPGNWAPSALTPVQQGDTWQAHAPLTPGTNKFFRLIRP